MSDLANFVAATIESKVVADLKEENDHLRLENEQLRAEINTTRDAAIRTARVEGGRIEVTGRGGAPIYAVGRFEDAQPYTTNRENVYKFAISLTKVEECPVKEALTVAEIRVNGSKIASMSDSEYLSDTDTIDGEFWEINQLSAMHTGWEQIEIDFIVAPHGDHNGGINHDQLEGDWTGDWSNLEQQYVRDFRFNKIYIETEVAEGDLFHRMVPAAGDI